MKIDNEVRDIADGLGKALLANDGMAIAGGISALSIRLGGDTLEGASMAPHAYVLYVLCQVIKAVAPAEPAQVISLHGVPLQ